MQTIQGWIAMAVLAMAGQGAAAEAPTFDSQVAGIHATALAQLPPAPAREPDDDPGCMDGRGGGIRSAAARQLRAAGWAVNSEQLLDGYHLLGFHAHARAGISGSCLLRDGNVAVYRDSRLLGVVYGTPDDADAPAPVASVAASAAAHTVRLWDGDIVASASADLQLGPDAIRVLPVAVDEAVCGGRARLPNVRGQPIAQARRALIAAGWTPRRAAAPAGDDGLRQTLAADGIVELDDCSGTGFMYCGFGYTHAGGLALDVTTVGEGYRVQDYGVRCGDMR
jgi:hypothetical protein